MLELPMAAAGRVLAPAIILQFTQNITYFHLLRFAKFCPEHARLTFELSGAALAASGGARSAE